MMRRKGSKGKVQKYCFGSPNQGHRGYRRYLYTEAMNKPSLKDKAKQMNGPRSKVIITLLVYCLWFVNGGLQWAPVLMHAFLLAPILAGRDRSHYGLGPSCTYHRLSAIKHCICILHVLPSAFQLP